MPDKDEFDAALEGPLTKLFDPDSGYTDEELNEDIRYFEDKITRYRENFKGDLESEEFKRFIMKPESQLQLLKETRDAFLASRKQDDD